jgi:hypothetical protein
MADALGALGAAGGLYFYAGAGGAALLGAIAIALLRARAAAAAAARTEAVAALRGRRRGAPRDKDSGRLGGSKGQATPQSYTDNPLRARALVRAK